MGKRKKFPDDIEINYHATTQYQMVIKEIDDEITSYEDLIQDLKDKKIKVGRELLPQHLLWDLFYNQNVSSKDICAKFFVNNLYDLKNMIGSCDVVSKCGVCEKELRVTVTSLTHLKEVRQSAGVAVSNFPGDTNYRFPGFKRVDNRFLCDECYEEETQKHVEAREVAQQQFGIRLQELKEMDYTDYLKTPEWEATRKDMLHRTGYKCQLCNTNKITLNVHHKTYERIGEEHRDDLIVLCRDCHGRHHEVSNEK